MLSLVVSAIVKMLHIRLFLSLVNLANRLAPVQVQNGEAMNADTPKNLLILGLPADVAQAILSQSEFVHLDLRENIIDPNKPIAFVDFPEAGVMSMLQPMADGRVVEIANIGNEGMVGSTAALGVSTIAQVVFCQVEGSAWRVPIKPFLALVEKYPSLLALCQGYAVTLFDQVARNLGCNLNHSIEERCARRFLLTHDRCHNNQFILTQESLSSMLGVTRSGVNLAAGALSNARLISYVRGKITVLDRVGLEAVSCKCYESKGEDLNAGVGRTLLSGSNV